MLATQINSALIWASKRHADRKQRYGSKPYQFHLLAVLSVLFEFGITDEPTLIAALLHDTEEDTIDYSPDGKPDPNVLKAFHEEIKDKWGERVKELVSCVTNETHNSFGEKLKDRRQKGAATWPKIARDPQARLLKLADRIANVRSCWQELQHQDMNRRNKSKLGMYQKEYAAFRKALRPNTPTDLELSMWIELDRLLAWLP